MVRCSYHLWAEFPGLNFCCVHSEVFPPLLHWVLGFAPSSSYQALVWMIRMMTVSILSFRQLKKGMLTSSQRPLYMMTTGLIRRVPPVLLYGAQAPSVQLRVPDSWQAEGMGPWTGAGDWCSRGVNYRNQFSVVFPCSKEKPVSPPLLSLQISVAAGGTTGDCVFVSG